VSSGSSEVEVVDTAAGVTAGVSSGSSEVEVVDTAVGVTAGVSSGLPEVEVVDTVVGVTADASSGLPEVEVADPGVVNTKALDSCVTIGASCATLDVCRNGLKCVGDMCRVCGALGAACATGDCCAAEFECRARICCVPCGAQGAACAPGDCCAAGLECRDGACRVPCGTLGDACAESGCCGAGLRCNSEAVCECTVGLGQPCGPAHGGCCANANATCEPDAAGASTCCFARGQWCGVTSHCCGDDECVRNVCVAKCVPPAPGACHRGKPCCGGKTCVELTSGMTGEPSGLFGCGDVCSAAECTSNADCCSSMTCEAGVCTPYCIPYGAVQHSADQGCCESMNGGAIRTVNAPGGPVEMCISSNDATYAKTGCWPPPRRPPEVGGNCTGVVGEACRVGTCYGSSNLGGGCCNGLFCGADQTCKCTAREGNPCGPGGCCFQGLACSDGICTCRAEGEACLESAGCCNDGLCANGVCVAPVGGTACAGAAQPCAVSAECCGGMAAFCGESNSLDPYVGRRCRAQRQGDEEPVYPDYAAQGIQHRDILQETFCGNALGYGWDAGTMRNPAFAVTCRSKYAQVRGYQGRRLERCEVREVNGVPRCRSSAEVIEA